MKKGNVKDKSETEKERGKRRERQGKEGKIGLTVVGRSPGNKTWHGIEVDKTNDENALI